MNTYYRLYITTLFGFALCVAANAQQEAEDDAVFALSPFEVSAADNEGYRATSTLAGSRLNTDLKDVAASLTVLTPELLSDVGATNLQEALQFAPNTELQEAGNLDGSLQFRRAPYRIRGFVGNEKGYSRGFYRSSLAPDFYNMERLTFSRGPNSILFGAGQAFGVINLAPKKAIFGAVNEIQLKVDSEGSLRGSFDFNRALIEDKLAFRVAGVRADLESYRTPTIDLDNRVYLAAQYRPFGNTTIHANYEQADYDRTIAGANAYRDRFSRVAPGSLYDGATVPEGVGINGGDRLVSMMTFDENGTETLTIFNRRGTSFSNGPTVDGNDINALRPDLFSNEAVPFAIVSTQSEQFDVYNLSIEQKITEDFRIQLGYNLEEREFDTRLGVNTPTVRIDTDQFLPDGTANPNAGRHYFEQNDTRWNFLPLDTETLRATASYELDFSEDSKFLGKHQFALLVERETNEAVHDKFDLRNYTPTTFNSLYSGNQAMSNTAITNGENIIQTRHYFTPGDESSMIVPAGFDLGFFDGERLLAPGVNAGWARSRGPNFDRQTFETLALSAQSYWWDGRLTTTLGVRQDDIVQYTKGAARNPAGTVTSDGSNNNQFRDPYTTTFRENPTQDLTFDSANVGGVFDINDSISLTYNTSENINRPSSRTDYFGGTQPAPTGEGTDIGIRFDLFEGKLIGSLTWYETLLIGDENLGQRNAAGGARLRLPDAVARMQETVNPTVFNDTLSDTSNISFIRDFQSEGVELSLTYNPSPNWRMIFNLAQKENVLTNQASGLLAYLDVYRADWEASSGSPLVSPGSGNASSIVTVGDALADLDKTLNFRLAQDGRPEAAEREYVASFVTSYDFADDGPLKGVRVGTNFKWGSAAGIGFFKDSTGAFDFNNRIDGDEYLDVGFQFSYSRPISDSIDLRLQLNVQNAFQSRIQPTEAFEDADGSVVITDYLFKNPRRFELTSTFSW